MPEISQKFVRVIVYLSFIKLDFGDSFFLFGG